MADREQSEAWADINPPMASAPRQGQASPSSAGLEPATAEQFRNELVACLALVAPVGMTEESRRDWLAVAWGTLKHLPADLLAIGCKAARETCDHPSKLVPAILQATEQSMRWRKDAARENTDSPRLASPDFCTPAEADAILRQYGLKPNPAAPDQVA